MKNKKIIKENTNNLLRRDASDFNMLILILIGCLIIGISGTTSFAIFSGETNSVDKITGTVTKNDEPNVPLLASNMIPVYYDETNKVWKKADSTNSNENYKWYDYGNKMWANSVTVNDYQTSFSAMDYYADERITSIYGSSAMIYDNEPIINETGEAIFSGTGTRMGSMYGPSTTYEEFCGSINGTVYIDNLASTRLYTKVQCDDAYNAKIFDYTIKTGARNTYQKASLGTEISMNDINAMFVWIPRYKYTYFASNTPVEIQINFEKGTASTGTIKCTDAIAANSGKSENCTDTINGSIIKGKSTYTHPAFSFGDEELTGIWVGKFETSGEGASTIKPDFISTINDISTLFQYSRNMELAGNIYGFSQTGTTLNTYKGEITGDSNNLDTHLIKNMEWGAVTYFTHSKYGSCENGTCTEVGINNYFGDNFLAGCGAAAGSISSDFCNKYNTEKGKKASTTGNVYGIYDMSGGAYEFVMANMQDVNNKFYPKLSGTWSITNVPADKYYDKYSYDENGGGIQFSYGKLGDATIETQPDVDNNITWYDDYAVFFDLDAPWLSRGGSYDQYISTGMFYVISDYGYANYSGSRVVLSISSS